MSFRVALTPRFEERLEEIITYLKEQASAARQAFAAILVATRSLEENPRRCRMVPELGIDEIREIIVAMRYRVIFRVRDREGSVDVLTVRHGRQLLDFAELGDD